MLDLCKMLGEGEYHFQIHTINRAIHPKIELLCDGVCQRTHKLDSQIGFNGILKKGSVSEVKFSANNLDDFKDDDPVIYLVAFNSGTWNSTAKWLTKNQVTIQKDSSSGEPLLKIKESPLVNEFHKYDKFFREEVTKLQKDECRHQWKEIGGFMPGSKYTVCSKCNIDKELGK